MTVQAIVSSYMLVDLAYESQLFSASNRHNWTCGVCYFQVAAGDSAVLRSKCHGNVGECPCVGIWFCALKIDVCFMSNLG